MLRTSLRNVVEIMFDGRQREFLSSNAQDFIEEMMIVFRALIFDWDS